MRIRKAGFTLIELMIVLVVVSILAAIALISINARAKDDDMRQTVVQFMSMVKEARRTAISLRQRVTFEFTRTSFRWCTIDCTVLSTPTTPASRVFNARRVKVLKYARASVIRGILPGTFTNVAAGATHRFYFEPDGTMIGYTDDTLPRGITLYFQHDLTATLQVRVPILPLVGTATVIPAW
jgi:prepilin-type N-terminal cleavage/methylation domain-containing protein